MRSCIHCGSEVGNLDYLCPNCGRMADGRNTMRRRGYIGFLSLGIGILLGVYVSWWLTPIVFFGGTFIGKMIFR